MRIVRDITLSKETHLLFQHQPEQVPQAMPSEKPQEEKQPPEDTTEHAKQKEEDVQKAVNKLMDKFSYSNVADVIKALILKYAKNPNAPAPNSVTSTPARPSTKPNTVPKGPVPLGPQTDPRSLRLTPLYQPVTPRPPASPPPGTRVREGTPTVINTAKPARTSADYPKLPDIVFIGKNHQNKNGCPVVITMKGDQVTVQDAARDFLCTPANDYRSLLDARKALWHLQNQLSKSRPEHNILEDAAQKISAKLSTIRSVAKNGSGPEHDASLAMVLGAHAMTMTKDKADAYLAARGIMMKQMPDGRIIGVPNTADRGYKVKMGLARQELREQENGVTKGLPAYGPQSYDEIEDRRKASPPLPPPEPPAKERII